MAGTPQGMSDRSALVAEHGASLHRVAAMLTGNTDSATRLTALALAQAPASAGARELRQATVRAYLRTAPRRTERAVPADVRDAGDALERLLPRERAVATLRLVEGASTADVARMLALSPEKVTRLEPTTPGLDAALIAIGDRYALAGPELATELEPAVAHAPPAPPAARSRWWWAAAAALPLGLLAGYALSLDDGAEEDLEADASTTAPPWGAPVDLTEVGFELDDGEPPGGAGGLRLTDTIEVAAGRTAQVDLDAGEAWYGGPSATFAVLWCDMPPADDPNLDTPTGEIAVAGTTVSVPCAGTQGTPAVSLDHVVALPPTGQAEVRVEGDLPPEGRALLAIFAENSDFANAPLPRGDLTVGPPVPEGAVTVDDEGPSMPYYSNLARRVAPLEIGPGSTVRVWAGRTGALTVMVDGVPVTDDGDLARYSGAALDWREQRPDVRDGRWMIHAPGMAREFTVPAELLPERGRRSATVEVLAEGNDEHVQVVVTDAAEEQADRAALPRAAGSARAPELISGHRLVGAWEAPMDGLERELLDAPGQSEAFWLMLGADATERSVPWLPFGEGAVRGAEGLTSLWVVSEARDISRALQESWMMGDQWAEVDALPEIDGLRVTAPATPDHPLGTLLAYEPVPYEDFDFAAAEVPASSWLTGEEPSDSRFPPTSPLATISGDDLDEDGTATVTLRNGQLGARIVTEGRGRIHFELDGRPVELLQRTDGWWSSWTDRAVTSETDLSWGGTGLPGDVELTVTVEDYDDILIDVFGP